MGAVSTGIGIGGGSAAGPVARMAPPPALPAARTVPAGQADAEAAAVRAALRDVAADLERRAAAAGQAAGQAAGEAEGQAAAVLSAQAMMAADPVLADTADAHIRGGADGPHALAAAIGEFRAALAAAGGHFAERVADLDDLRDRALARLLGLPMPEKERVVHS